MRKIIDSPELPDKMPLMKQPSVHWNSKINRVMLTWIIFGVLLLSAACAPTVASPTAPAVPASSTPTETRSPSPTATPVPTGTSAPSPTPQPRLTFPPEGPDQDKFPSGISPLTGLRLQDPTMLNLPAVLVSISNMPPTARPQAGLSFVPWNYEIFIAEGTTRFMSVFYGDLPRRISNDLGDCPVNTTIFQPHGSWVGKRVWLDENKDGIQEPWEAGVGGVCVRLIDTASGKQLASTSTDSNGYYAFDTSGLQATSDYTLDFKIPVAYQFTQPNLGFDNLDSDADPASGEVHFTYNGATDMSLDAGLVLVKPGQPVYAASDIAPARTYVGPIRSGRLTYNDFHAMYPASCLIYASAGDGIRQQLKGCEIIFGAEPTESPNTALLDTLHLLELAQQNKVPNQPVNYSGHLFDPVPPASGLPAATLWTYFHAFSQALWQYDPVSGSYLRQTDDGDGKGVFHMDTDRLTGRQLSFENLAIIMADYTVFRHGQYDINLCCGFEGFAFVFRDGQMYKVRWSTTNGAWEKATGLLRPLHFTFPDRTPFPLKPGRTWVSVMTINSAMKDLLNGKWQALFAMPDDTAPPKNVK